MINYGRLGINLCLLIAEIEKTGDLLDEAWKGTLWILFAVYLKVLIAYNCFIQIASFITNLSDHNLLEVFFLKFILLYEAINLFQHGVIHYDIEVLILQHIIKSKPKIGSILQSNIILRNFNALSNQENKFISINFELLLHDI